MMICLSPCGHCHIHLVEFFALAIHANQGVIEMPPRVEFSKAILHDSEPRVS